MGAPDRRRLPVTLGHERNAGNGAPRVLVLLACFNGQSWIAEQLQSILAQQGVRTRIIIRDDGSSDMTLARIAALGSDERMTVAQASAPTGSAAQNFLTLIRDNSAESYDFVALADQDDVWYGNKLARACRILGGTECAGYSSATLATWSNGRSTLLRQAPRITAGDFLFEGAGQGCTFLLRAGFYAEIRRFVADHQALTRTVHYHDWLIYALARACGKTWAFDPSPSVYYRQHERNDTGARGRLGSAVKRLGLIRKRWYRDQLAVVAQICAAAAPGNRLVRSWISILLAEPGWRRRLQMASFCLRNSRRRRRDRAVLVLAALAGWI